MKQLTEQQIKCAGNYMSCVKTMLEVGSTSELLKGIEDEVLTFLEDNDYLLEATRSYTGRPVDLILCVCVMDSSDKDTAIKNRTVLKELEQSLINYVRETNMTILNGYKFEDITIFSTMSKDGKEENKHIICTCLSEDYGEVQ